MSYDCIIIGAGISGLVAAYYLKQAGCNILLLESNDRVGGVIQSYNVEGFLLERGPNSLRGTHEFLDLIDELKLNEEMVTANPTAPAYVYFNHSLHPVPMSLPAFVKSKLLSTRAKLRLLREPFISARYETSEESLASFVSRRLGAEVLERLVAPFVSGVFAGDPELLSVQASFAKLAELEANGGSIFRGAVKATRAARANKIKPARSLRPYRLCSFRSGLQTLTDALAKAIGESLLMNATIHSISQKSNSQFEIVYGHLGHRTTINSHSLVVATPADAAAQMVSQFAPELSDLLMEIPYTTIAAVPLAYHRWQISHSMNGFGFLAPRGQGLRTLGSIWNSSLFANRAPAGFVLTNNFIGGETDRNAVNLSDEDLIQIVHRDLQTVLGISGDPIRLPITRWQRAIPQYVLGHAVRVRQIEAALKKQTSLFLVGNYLRGVALGDLIRDSRQVADRIVSAHRRRSEHLFSPFGFSADL